MFKERTPIACASWSSLNCYFSEDENGMQRDLMTFRQCLEKCVSRNYHGSTPSTVCSFSRSANYKQSWNGPPVKVDPPTSQPHYGQMVRYDETLPAGDVRKTSQTMPRVIHRLLRKKRKVTTLSVDSHGDYVSICYNCITETCRSFLFFGKYSPFYFSVTT